MFFAESASDHPVTALAPLTTGCADGAARHTTRYPLLPESAAVSRSGAESRYPPSASSTTMSPDIELLRDRTAVWAAVSEHGCTAEQLVPVPKGEAYSVVVAAKAGETEATMATGAVSPTAATAASS